MGNLDLKQKFNYKIGIVIASAAVLSYLSLCFILAPPVNIANTDVVNGHFKNIVQQVTRGEKSYNLYLETHESYKIAAEHSECFEYGTFLNEVKPGQLIRLYISKPVTFFDVNNPMVVFVGADNTQYLGFGCVNDDIAAFKIKGPIYVIVIFLLILAILYKKELKTRLK